MVYNDCVKRTNIYLSEPDASILAEIAKSKGIPTSELIRRLISQYIEKVAKDAKK